MRWDVDWLRERSRLYPGKTAAADGLTGKEWTYEDLYRRSKIAEQILLKKGIASGDRIAILGPNNISYIDFMFAARRIGAVFVPLNWRLAREELAYIIADCEPALLIYHEDYEEISLSLKVKEYLSFNDFESELQAASPIIPSTPDKPFINMDSLWMIIYTGGTTGKPKGVVLTNRTVYANAQNTVLSWELNAEDVTLTLLPMFHTGGINALTLPVLLAGGTVVIGSSFNPPDVVRQLIEYKCTIVLMVPTMYHGLIHEESFQKQSFPHIKAFLSGGAPCPLSVYSFFQKRGLPFKEGYGLTEAGPNNFFISPERAAVKNGSVGKPMIYNEVKIVDDRLKPVDKGETGELAIYGEHVFLNYWKNEAETNKAIKDGWLLTGDLAREDEEGDFYILGRKKDMVITGGENVYPQEVEQIINEHPAVKEAAVIGLPHDKWGEIVAAVIVPVPGETVGEDDIESFCSEKLARYKVPKQIYFTESLPVTHVGKIDKKQLVLKYNHSMKLN